MKLDSVVFYSKNIETTKNFYLDHLNLNHEYQQGDRYASLLFENGLRLGICKSHHDRELPGAQTMIITTNDARKQYLMFKNSGIEFLTPYEEYEWGKIFSIADPDGNKIEFLQRK